MQPPVALLCAVAIAMLACLASLPSSPRAYAAPDPATAAPPASSVPPATVCTGVASTDAPLAACGVTLGAAPVAFVWSNGPTPIATALAAPRLAFHGAPPSVEARPLDFVVVWQRDGSTGAWRSWSSAPLGPFATLETFEPGQTYIALTSRAPGSNSTTTLDLSLAPLHTSVLPGARIVSLYGRPGVPEMGALGGYPTAEAAAAAVEVLALQYVPLSGETRVVPALHLIVAMAQADPGYDGTYLGRLTEAEIRPYVEATRARGELLFLDVQVGWSDPLAETELLAPLLREPHVHLALDPEFATRGKQEPPGEAIGYLLPEQVNAVQAALATYTAEGAIPSKVLVLHQFRADMLPDAERIARVAGVDVVIDMDGWGPPGQKFDSYAAYAHAVPGTYPGFKLFFRWDQPLLTPEQVMALPVPPDYVIYQ